MSPPRTMPAGWCQVLRCRLFFTAVAAFLEIAAPDVPAYYPPTLHLNTDRTKVTAVFDTYIVVAQHLDHPPEAWEGLFDDVSGRTCLV